MGILTEIISQEFAKKREQKAAEIQAYGAMLGQSDLKPELREAALGSLAKAVGPHGKGIVDLIGKMVQRRSQSAPGAGGAQKLRNPLGGGGAPAGEGGDEGGGAFYTPEQIEKQKLAQQDAEEKQRAKNELDLAVKRTNAEAAAKQSADQKNSQFKMTETARIHQDQSKTPEQQQTEIAALWSREPKFDTGYLVSPNGKGRLVVTYDTADKQQRWVGKQKIEGPTGWEFLTKSEFLAKEAEYRKEATAAESERRADAKQPKKDDKQVDEERAFKAWREQHGKSDEYQMTATEEEQALAKPDKPTGEYAQRVEAEKVLADTKSLPIEKKAARDTLKNLDAKAQGVTIRNEVGASGVPGSAGAVATPTGGKHPIEALTPKQRDLVKTTENYLSKLIPSMGYGAGVRNEVNEGIRIIGDATGLPPEVINARVDRRQGALKAYNNIKPMESAYSGLADALDRHATILNNLRSQLPNNDIAKINQWLISGAREFDVGGVSEAATRYGAALAAVRNEYARIIAGGASSIAQVSPEALKSAGEVISPGFTKGNMKSLVDQFGVEAKQKLGGYRDQEKSLLGEISQRLVPELYGEKYKEVEPVPPPGSGGNHRIQIGDKQYDYKGSGATDDLKNYTEVQK
jgi:hypothetical protein